MAFAGLSIVRAMPVHDGAGFPACRDNPDAVLPMRSMNRAICLSFSLHSIKLLMVMCTNLVRPEKST